MEGTVQIKDILSRSVFAEAQVVAGALGVTRLVRWVHILEISNIRTLIHGGELVLTTGTVFQADESSFPDFVEQLVTFGAAGLCVELGSIKAIPDSVCTFADAHRFPVIVFPRQVRFVDITEDVHRYILSRHHKLLDDVENIARNLQHIPFHEGAIRQILSTLHQATDYTVLFGRIGQRPVFEGNVWQLSQLSVHWYDDIVPLADSEQPPVVRSIPKEWLSNNETPPLSLIVQPLWVLGIKKSVLALICPSRSINEYLLLLMDKAISTLAQHEFHRITVQERQVFYEQDLVEHLLREPETLMLHDALRQGANAPRFKAGGKHFTVCFLHTLQTRNVGNEDWHNLRSGITLSIKQVFNKFDLKTYLSVRPDSITAVLELPAQNIALKGILEQVVAQIEDTLDTPEEFRGTMRGGVGRIVQNLKQIRQSYDDAALALQIADQTPHTPIVLYEEAGVYRWLSLLTDDERLHRLMQLDIGQILTYDRQHGTELVRTLKTYLDCNQSKQKTADTLFIHRQTLYHRLGQISQLLDCDLDDAKIRLSLHLSLYYHEYRIEQ